MASVQRHGMDSGFMTDAVTGQSRGYGSVRFSDETD
jgi:hypothetical protein